MLTTAERLRREGREEAKREVLLFVLRQRFGRLPATAVARIDKAQVAELDVWFKRGLTASSLDDVLAPKVAVTPTKAVQPARAQPRGARQRTRG
ncbi:MAG: hypothetical protein QM820_00935 [Minicystis sp.]